MRERWGRLEVDKNLGLCSLGQELEHLAESRLVELPGGAVVLEPFSAMRRDQSLATEFEALANKVHIEDYVARDRSGLATLANQGILFCRRLVARLELLPGSFLIVLAIDEELPSVVARFFKERTGEQWLSSDLERFTEALAIWKTGGR
jgi:hypothetical protein